MNSLRNVCSENIISHASDKKIFKNKRALLFPSGAINMRTYVFILVIFLVVVWLLPYVYDAIVAAQHERISACGKNEDCIFQSFAWRNCMGGMSGCFNRAHKPRGYFSVRKPRAMCSFDFDFGPETECACIANQCQRTVSVGNSH